MEAIHVLIVDDSASVRRAMSMILTADPAFTVEVASDPFAAARIIAHRVPDVIMLDVEMPRMDGITFLRKLMDQCPCPW
jgi:two-component system chemotaxis response regulator CheB